MKEFIPFLMDGLTGDDTLLGGLYILLAVCGLGWCAWVWRMAVLDRRARKAQQVREMKEGLLVARRMRLRICGAVPREEIRGQAADYAWLD